MWKERRCWSQSVGTIMSYAPAYSTLYARCPQHKIICTIYKDTCFRIEHQQQEKLLLLFLFLSGALWCFWSSTVDFSSNSFNGLQSVRNASYVEMIDWSGGGLLLLVNATWAKWIIIIYCRDHTFKCKFKRFDFLQYPLVAELKLQKARIDYIWNLSPSFSPVDDDFPMCSSTRWQPAEEPTGMYIRLLVYNLAERCKERNFTLSVIQIIIASYPKKYNRV